MPGDVLIYAQSHSLMCTRTHKLSEGLINISQGEEEAHTWNLDALFGHDGRREGPELTGRGIEM